MLNAHWRGARADVAQLVEHDLAKVGVASSSLVIRSPRSLSDNRVAASLLGETPISTTASSEATGVTFGATRWPFWDLVVGCPSG